jgi:hypothetical protein
MVQVQGRRARGQFSQLDPRTGDQVVRTVANLDMTRSTAGETWCAIAVAGRVIPHSLAERRLVRNVIDTIVESRVMSGIRCGQ